MAFAILARGRCACPYNVGSDEAMSIRELAETVRDVLRPNAQVVVMGSNGTSPSVYVPNIGRAASELGLGVVMGIREAVELSSPRGV